MDLSGIIVIIVLSALFFGFIVWLNIHSRRIDAGRTRQEVPETGANKE